MRAHAKVAAQADGRGGTRLTQLRGESPLLLRQTHTDGRLCTVHLVGGAAAPIGGDELRLDIEVGQDAALCLRSVAATLVLPGPGGARSQFVIVATVAGGGTLHWLPEPTIAAADSRHTTRATIELDEGAALLWRDELICGRHGEPTGQATVTTSARYAGKPLLHQTLAVGPGADGWAGPAVLGGAKATGSLLHVHPGTQPPPPRILGPCAVQMPLAGPASLTTVTADDAHLLRECLTFTAG